RVGIFLISVFGSYPRVVRTRIFGERAYGVADCLCLCVPIFCVFCLFAFFNGKFSASARWAASHLQNRVSSAERVGHTILRQRIGHPLAVHYEAVFVGAGRQSRLLQPMTVSRGMHVLGFGLPVVESPGDTNGAGRRMSEFEVDRFQLETVAFYVVMVFVVFHSCKFNWFLWRNSFAEHVCYDEDENRSANASSEKEIQQGVTCGGKHGLYNQCN